MVHKSDEAFGSDPTDGLSRTSSPVITPIPLCCRCHLMTALGLGIEYAGFPPVTIYADWTRPSNPMTTLARDRRQTVFQCRSAA